MCDLHVRLLYVERSIDVLHPKDITIVSTDRTGYLFAHATNFSYSQNSSE